MNTRLQRSLSAFCVTFFLWPSPASAQVVRSGDLTIREDGYASLAAARGPRPKRARLPQSEVVVSLRRLQEQIKRVDRVASLPDEVRRLCGLQRVDEVELIPGRDVLLRGRGERNATDSAVGRVTPQTMRIEILLEAMRVTQEDGATFSVSIDPDAKRLAIVFQKIGSADVVTTKRVAEWLGPQRVTFAGVDGRTEYARVLLAADIRLKQLALGVTRGAPRGFRSFASIARRAGAARFSVECRAKPVMWFKNRNSWRLGGCNVNVRGRTGDDLAGRRWAASTSERMDELEECFDEFAKLENVAMMSVAAALIRRMDLIAEARLDPNVFVSCPIVNGALPKLAKTEVGSSRTRTRLTFAAGGVTVDPWPQILVQDADVRTPDAVPIEDGGVRNDDSSPQREAPLPVTYWGIPVRCPRVVFVLDCSQSMRRDVAGSNRLDLAKRELERTLTALPATTEFGVIAYSDKGLAWRPVLVNATLLNKAAASRWIRRRDAGGGTATFDALCRALKLGRSCEIFLLTDGWPTCGRYIRPERIVARSLAANSKRHSVVHTLGFGCGTAQMQFLASLAKAHQGRCRHVVVE